MYLKINLVFTALLLRVRHLFVRRPLIGVIIVVVIAAAAVALAISVSTPWSGSSTPSVTQYGADPTGRADSTGAFNECLTAHPAGNILVPAGQYRINGSIVKNRNQNLIGAGAKASILMCESTTSACVVAADTTGAMNYAPSTIENLTVEGPGIDSNNTSIGLYFGGDLAGRISSTQAFGDGIDILNVRITGFNHGIEWGNNAWGNKLIRSLIFGNATGLYVPGKTVNSGESIGITDSGIFNNRDFGLDDHSNFEWMMTGSSFDYNGAAIQFLGSTIHAVNMHFEQTGGHVVFQPYGAGCLSIRDSEILLQATSGNDHYIIDLWPQTLALSVDDVSIYSNHPVQYFLHAGGVTSGTITNLYGNGNKTIHALSDAISHVNTISTSAF